MEYIYGVGIALIFLGIIFWWWRRKKRPRGSGGPRESGGGGTPPRFSFEQPSPQSTPQQPTPQPPPAVQRNITRPNKNKLARKLGITKLQKKLYKLNQELPQGVREAQNLHGKATKAGWTKTKEGKKHYNAWYRQYTQNINNEKEIKKIQQRIAHLQAKLSRI